MDMKNPYRSIKVKARQQKVSYAIVKIYKILTYNVINWHCPFLRVEVSCYDVLHMEGTAVALKPYTVGDSVFLLSNGKMPATDEQIETKESRIIEFEKH